MKDQLPYVPWYQGDFLRSTAGWTLLERAAYWMLLCAEWESGPLPNDPQRLAMIAGLYPDEFIVLWRQQLSRKFHGDPNGDLINDRMEAHRAKHQQFRAKQVASGKKGAASRWHKKGKVIEFSRIEGRDD